jgi:hypothetical protein
MNDNDQPVLIENPKDDVQTSRRFCRNIPLGMQVYRSMTVNFTLGQVIEHIELACPKFTLTNDGPRLKTEQELAVESEIESI